MDRQKCVEKASEILAKYGDFIEEPFVNVFAIAKAEGFEVFRFKPETDMLDVSGFSTEDKKIYINQYDTLERQTFTIAHELGHYFLGHVAGNQFGVHYRNSLSHKGDWNSEKEANLFAAELLMPEEFIERATGEYGLDRNKDVDTLAKVFGVSKSAMSFRLGDIDV